MLLITAEFINSDFCQLVEFERALERERSGHCKILPVNVGSVDLHEKHPLRAFQHVPQGKPISEIKSPRAAAWKKVAKALRCCVEELLANGIYPAGPDESQAPQNVFSLSERRENAAARGNRRLDHLSRSRGMRYENLPSSQGARAATDWRYLSHLLRMTRFDNTDWKSLAMSTGRLREELAHLHLPPGMFPVRAEDVADALRQTLATAVNPSATTASVRSACVTCERLRGWLIDILTDSPR